METQCFFFHPQKKTKFAIPTCFTTFENTIEDACEDAGANADGGGKQ